MLWFTPPTVDVAAALRDAAAFFVLGLPFLAAAVGAVAAVDALISGTAPADQG